jgi:hypothetical protein
MSDLVFEQGSSGYCSLADGSAKLITYTQSPHAHGMHYSNFKINNNRLPTPHSVFRDKGFQDMLDNNYPTLDAAWQKISAPVLEKDMTIAFNKHWAFNRSTLNVVTLHYKGEQVGEVVLGNGNTYSDVKLYPSLDYLKRNANRDLGLTLEVFNLNS